MSKFSPHLGSCQRQFSKKVESLAPTVIPRGFLNQLGFAMWTPTTRQKHSRTVTRYQTDLTDTEWDWPAIQALERECKLSFTSKKIHQRFLKLRAARSLK